MPLGEASKLGGVLERGGGRGGPLADSTYCSYCLTGNSCASVRGSLSERSSSFTITVCCGDCGVHGYGFKRTGLMMSCFSRRCQCKRLQHMAVWCCKQHFSRTSTGTDSSYVRNSCRDLQFKAQ